MDKNEIILFIIIVLASGLVILLLSGLFVVKENHIAIFEKMYKYYTHKGKGIYFFTPFLTKRVGNYSLENQYIKLNLKNTSIYIIYKIDDVLKYHYSNDKLFKNQIYELLLKWEEEKLDLENEIDNFVKNRGIKIIRIKKGEDSN